MRFFRARGAAAMVPCSKITQTCSELVLSFRDRHQQDRTMVDVEGSSMRKLLSVLCAGLWRGLHGRFGLVPNSELKD
ncbi:hypothetical protein QA635_36860 [Bradyrhizobium brasilense]|uniref:hypothetical protein n=1 Tax=Bradyrhizobium brasilense TaxID=1419277 RepID=UPI0024B0F1CE|nr:hypothetical protein [Bradyrhizobium australafricanum]WFU32004.1 hypothetical protein QA635_36860 [Bradyrhizobium australafricanum]